MSENTLKTGRVTIPTNLDVVPQTIEILKRWGADAIRDCDGTEFPEELTKVGAKIYSTYYTTRKDNAWAKANPDEVQGAAVLHHDRLLHLRRRGAAHPPDAGHLGGADAGKHPG